VSRERATVVRAVSEAPSPLSLRPASRKPSRLLDVGGARRVTLTAARRSIAVTSTDDFTQFVRKLLNCYVRRAGEREDREGRRSPPPDAAFAHLSEMVVRTALRDGWNIRDLKTTVSRIQQMIFQPGGELPAVAKHSGLEFVEDETSQELLLAISDMLYQIPIRDRALSRSTAAFDLGKLHTIMDTGLCEHLPCLIPPD